MRGRYPHVYYAGKKFTRWKTLVEQDLDNQVIHTLRGPVFVQMQFLISQPLTKDGKKITDRVTEPVPHIEIPDTDNLTKIILDGATKGGLWEDDCEVHKYEVEKWVVPDNWATGCLIHARELFEYEYKFEPLFDHPLEIENG